MPNPSSPSIEDVLKIAQECLGKVPVTVLGSGASLAYGVGGMGELQDFLLRHIVPDVGEDEVWNRFKEALAETGDLERSLHMVQLPEGLESRVVVATRSMVVLTTSS